MYLTRGNRDKAGKIKTETFLDSLVRQLSVYVVAAIGLFLIIKEFLIGKYRDYLNGQFCDRLFLFGIKKLRETFLP